MCSLPVAGRCKLWRSSLVSTLPVLDMCNLTNLAEFSASHQLLVGSVLPKGLQRLDLPAANEEQLAAVVPLKQLTALSMTAGFEAVAPLLQLAQLPKLQLLQLGYDPHTTPAVIAASVAAWGQLPQLRELQVGCSNSSVGHVPTQQQMAAILAGLVAATTLTKLDLSLQRTIDHAQQDEDDGDDNDAGEPQPVAACAFIARLTRLRHLELSCRVRTLVPADALALTALTGLTHLQLDNGGKGVGDVVATALACSLKQLCHLELKECDLGYMACLAPIEHLRQLRELHLIDGGVSSSERAGLEPSRPLPRQLSRLQHLGFVLIRGRGEGEYVRFLAVGYVQRPQPKWWD